MLNSAKDEFLKRIMLVRSCQCLKEVENFGRAIISLLGNVQSYGYGEVILKQGKIVCFYFRDKS